MLRELPFQKRMYISLAVGLENALPNGHWCCIDRVKDERRCRTRAGPLLGSFRGPFLMPQRTMNGKTSRDKHGHDHNDSELNHRKRSRAQYRTIWVRRQGFT